MRAGVGVAWLVLAGGCAGACPEPVVRAEPEPARVVDPSTPLCPEVVRSIFWAGGVRCRMIGVYTTVVVHGKGGVVIDVWPQVYPQRGGPVLLENLWEPASKHDARTIAGYMGKVVEVEGVLHRAPPGRRENILWPTLSPVYAIRVVADRAPE